jgi:hypothetical protein
LVAAVVGLAVAAILLATSTNRVTSVASGVSSSAQTADLGARLDHRGLTYVAPGVGSSAQTADLGARLDHRGLKFRAAH